MLTGCETTAGEAVGYTAVLMSDEGTEQEPRSLSGNVEPSGPGEWMSYQAAAARWRIKPKAVYRRITRGQAPGRRNPETGEAEVWVPEQEEQRSRPEEREPGSLSVPDQREQRFLELLDRATASLGIQVQQLTEEREQARRERDEERARADELAAQLAASERARREAEARLTAKRWWWPW